MGAAVLVAVIFSVFFIIFKPGLHLAVAVGLVFFLSARIQHFRSFSFAVVRLLPVCCKGKFRLVRIMVGAAVFHFINIFLKAFNVQIDIVGHFSFRCTKKSIGRRMVNPGNGAADIVHPITVEKLAHIRGCLSEVCINGVKFQGAVYKIVPAASDISYFVHVPIIFKKAHQPCNTALNRSLIDNGGFRSPCLGAAFQNIVKHDCKRSLLYLLRIHFFSGKIAVLSVIFHQGGLLGISHSTRFIRFRLFGGADRLLFCLRFRFLRRLRFLSAACQKRRSQYQCAEKNSGFMQPFSICPEFSHSSLL